MTTKRAAKAKKASAPAAEPKRPSTASPTRGAPAKRRAPAPASAPPGVPPIDLKVSDTNLAWLQGLFGGAAPRPNADPRRAAPTRDTLAPPPPAKAAPTQATDAPPRRARAAATQRRAPAPTAPLPTPEERPTDPPAPSTAPASRAKAKPKSTPQPSRAPTSLSPEVEMQKPEPIVEVLKPKGPRRRVEKTEPARPEKKEVVVRIAQGMRKPKVAQPTLDLGGDGDDQPTGRANLEGLSPVARKRGAVVEINPRLQRSRPVVGGPAETPPPVADGSGKKVMSVAMKHRAAAEAMFSRLTADAPKPAEPAAVDAAPAEPEAPRAEEPPLPFAARSADEGGGSYSMRVSERDVLVTQLRLTTESDELLAAARALVERFALPADQAVLLKVIPLGDDQLTQVALEELLELQDRGRVRANPEILQVVGDIRSRSPDVTDLKTLLLQKLGARG